MSVKAGQALGGVKRKADISLKHEVKPSFSRAFKDLEMRNLLDDGLCMKMRRVNLTERIFPDYPAADPCTGVERDSSPAPVVIENGGTQYLKLCRPRDDAAASSEF